MIILHFQVLVMFVQIFIFVELAGSCRPTKEILAQIIVSVIFVVFAVRLVPGDPSCHCAQLRLFVILVKMVPFVICTLPSFIPLPFFFISFKIVILYYFRHFGWVFGPCYAPCHCTQRFSVIFVKIVQHFRHFGHFCWPLEPGSCLMNYANAS